MKRISLLLLCVMLMMSCLNVHATEETVEGKYRIEVDRTANITYVYEKTNDDWKCIREMACSTGRPGRETPTGTYEIWSHINKGGWYAMRNGTYGLYNIGISIGRGYTFTSVCYASTKDYQPIGQQMDDLGKSVSNGSIRLSLVDARWMYKNISDGTEVKIY